jgi:outer membrane protein assembly factor BamC
VFDSLYSTGERDKFRTRLERNANGGTEIYISHRGMIEVYSTAQKDQTVWQPRRRPRTGSRIPAPPDGQAGRERQEQSRALVAAGGTKRPTARVATVGNKPVVQMDEGFDRAWRRVGLTLDRTGFTVEDRDRSQGTYFVRYVEPNADKKEPGFFGKLFGRLHHGVGAQCHRRAESSANAQRIVNVIADDLK